MKPTTASRLNPFENRVTFEQTLQSIVQLLLSKSLREQGYV